MRFIAAILVLSAAASAVPTTRTTAGVVTGATIDGVDVYYGYDFLRFFAHTL